MLLCDHAFISENRKPGLIGIFDILGVPKTPAGHPQMFLFAHLKGVASSEYDLELRVHDPNGSEIKPSQGSATMKVKLSETGRGNVIHRFLNFPLNEIGKYRFSLYEGDNKLGDTKLSVIKVKSGTKINDFPN